MTRNTHRLLIQGCRWPPKATLLLPPVPAAGAGWLVPVLSPSLCNLRFIRGWVHRARCHVANILPACEERPRSGRVDGKGRRCYG